MTEPRRFLWLVLVLVAGLSLTGCAGGGTQEPVPPPPPPGNFSVSLQPNTVSVAQGATSSPVTVSVSPMNSFSGNVAFTIAGLPAGVSTSPALPFQVAAGASQSITFQAANSATLGPALLNFTGTSGSLSHSATAAMSISPLADFGLAVQPGSVSVTQGTSQAVSVLVTPLNSFAAKVTVTVNGLPAGAMSSPASFEVVGGSRQSVTLSADLSAAPGTANLSFQGVSGSLSHSANAAMQIQAATTPDFTVSVGTKMIALRQGSTSAGVPISVAPLNGFSGDVVVAISGLPAGVAASPGLTIHVPAGSSQPVEFTAAVNSKPVSNATVTFTGTNGSVSHSDTATMQILADAMFSWTYFNLSNTAFDEVVQIENPGIQSTPSTLGDLCANTYVFDQSQQLLECCSCPVTANGLIRFSVHNNLTANTANGFILTTGSIAVIPGSIPSSGFCDPTNVSPVPDLNVWGQHDSFPQFPGGLPLRKLETRAPDLVLGGNQLTSVVSTCNFIVADLSGAGICSCPSTN